MKKELKIFFLWCMVFYTMPMQSQPFNFKLGLENLSDQFIKKIKSYRYGGARIGLITNHTGIDQFGNRNIEVLRQQGLNIKYIFTPEHGYDGSIAAAHAVNNSRDKKTHIPIISLYGNGSGKTIAQHHMQHIDIFIFDIQDVGMRHYTYITTLFATLQTAAEHGKHYIVLDRPNPLGSVMEGPLVSGKIQKMNSFIAAAPIPLRHGMTVGELAWYFNKYVLAVPAKLHVVKMANYDRSLGLPTELKRGLSPNIQTRQACYGYSFLGLLGEVRPFSVGLGTPYAFSFLGLPEHFNFSTQLWHNIYERLKQAGIDSALYAYKNTNNLLYRGLQIRMSEISKVSSFIVLLDILKLVQKNGIKIQFSDYFNRAVGTHLVQDYVFNKITKQLFVEKINNDLKTFFNKAQNVFMYYPVPSHQLLK